MTLSDFDVGVTLVSSAVTAAAGVEEAEAAEPEDVLVPEGWQKRMVGLR